MVSDPIGMTNKVGRFLDIDSRKQLNLLRNRQVTEFNKYLDQQIPIHLPFENLSGYDLHEFSLQVSLLFMSNLSGAILLNANLYKANLSGAILLVANLSGAILLVANLSGANLYKANLLNTIMINCIYSKVIVDTHTDFSNAIADNPDFLKYLHEKGSQNIPNEIKNKQELRGELLKRHLDPKMLEFYLSLSQLPES